MQRSMLLLYRNKTSKRFSKMGAVKGSNALETLASKAATEHSGKRIRRRRQQ